MARLPLLLLFLAAWPACTGCAALEAAAARWEFLDWQYRDELLPIMQDGYERKLRLPLPPAGPAPEGLDLG